jgi:hypothetical protein
MKKSLKSLILISLFLALSVTGFAHTADNPYVTPLYAAGGNENGRILVGEVRAWNDGDHLYVKYMVTNSNWCLMLTHLHVATSMEDLPQKNGNPRPGRFDLQMPHECVSEYTYQIERTWPEGTNLYIAAHAEVCPVSEATSDIEGLLETLPLNVDMSVVQPSPDLMAYFRTTIAGGTSLDGTHQGWCIDLDRDIDRGPWYIANVYSLYDELPPNLVEFPENLDLVNWIIDQDFVGKASLADGLFTYGDVQAAIWDLIENEGGDYFNIDPWNRNRADEIIAAAVANGEGFVPACNERLLLILVPVNEEQEIVAQISCISIPVPCVPTGDCETAWGWGLDFPGRNWATYFTYTIQ